MDVRPSIIGKITEAKILMRRSGFGTSNNQMNFAKLFYKFGKDEQRDAYRGDRPR